MVAGKCPGCGFSKKDKEVVFKLLLFFFLRDLIDKTSAFLWQYCSEVLVPRNLTA